MRIRLGYVGLSLISGITSSSTITYTLFEKKNRDMTFIDLIIKKNLESLKELILFNMKNNIHFFRITSALIPLATHPDLNFDYITPYQQQYKEVGDLIKQSNLRVDVHPDQYTVINSTSPKVVQNSLKILNYHKKILLALDIKSAKIVLHVGSGTPNKEEGIKRFKRQFKKLDPEIKKMIILENDDKVYNIKDVLEICRELNIPMVLDYHHYKCNNNGEKLKDYLTDIIDTWTYSGRIPKIHMSSPKNKTKKEFRSHHDYINPDDFIELMNLLKIWNQDMDIMIEAKQKDRALFELVSNLKYRTNYKFIDETTIEL